MSERNLNLMRGQSVSRDTLMDSIKSTMSELGSGDNTIDFDNFIDQLVENLLDNTYEKFMDLAKLILDIAWDGNPNVKVKMELGTITMKFPERKVKEGTKLPPGEHRYITPHTIQAFTSGQILENQDGISKDDVEVVYDGEGKFTFTMKGPIYT